MMPVTIEKQIMIAAKATTVWQFIGTEAGLRQWWGLDITLEAKPGGRCEERTYWQGRSCYWRGTVTAYQPPHQLSLFLRSADETAPGPAWVTISLGLTEQNGQTQVSFVQQAYEPVVAETTVDQITTQPYPTVAPHAIWNRLSPQNALATLPSLPKGAAHTWPAIAHSWLIQQESCWQARLHTLTQQALLAPTIHAD